MEHRFDQLAKDLFRGLSRREALRRLGGTLAGGLFDSLGLDRAWAARPIGSGGNGNDGISAATAAA